MSCETELKLLLAPELHAFVAELPLIQDIRESTPRVRALTNTYFDTPELSLQQVRVALRIRTVDDGWIQTLKARGESVNGLSRRIEYEWPLSQPELDFSLFMPVWPKMLKDCDIQQLQPIFRTDFERTQQVLHWQGAKIEMALDSGQISAAGRHLTISELELELLEGDESALLDLGRLLSEQIALTPCDISKAERGYALLADDL